MDVMLRGDATQAQIAAFLALERVKGETLDELAGFAVVLRDKAETITPKVDNYIDLVGTGGDRTFTFNVSTTSALVVAAAGLPVAKHGNRSISSKSGAGDVVRGARRQYHGRSEESGGVCGDRPESVSCLRSFLTSPCAMSGRRAARWESVPSLIS